MARQHGRKQHVKPVVQTHWHAAAQATRQNGIASSVLTILERCFHKPQPVEAATWWHAPVACIVAAVFAAVLGFNFHGTVSSCCWLACALWCGIAYRECSRPLKWREGNATLEAHEKEQLVARSLRREQQQVRRRTRRPKGTQQELCTSFESQTSRHPSEKPKALLETSKPAEEGEEDEIEADTAAVDMVSHRSPLRVGSLAALPEDPDAVGASIDDDASTREADDVFSSDELPDADNPTDSEPLQSLRQSQDSAIDVVTPAFLEPLSTGCMDRQKIAGASQSLVHGADSQNDESQQGEFQAHAIVPPQVEVHETQELVLKKQVEQADTSLAPLEPDDIRPSARGTGHAKQEEKNRDSEMVGNPHEVNVMRSAEVDKLEGHHPDAVADKDVQRLDDGHRAQGLDVVLPLDSCGLLLGPMQQEQGTQQQTPTQLGNIDASYLPLEPEAEDCLDAGTGAHVPQVVLSAERHALGTCELEELCKDADACGLPQRPEAVRPSRTSEHPAPDVGELHHDYTPSGAGVKSADATGQKDREASPRTPARRRANNEASPPTPARRSASKEETHTSVNKLWSKLSHLSRTPSSGTDDERSGAPIRESSCPQLNMARLVLPRRESLTGSSPLERNRRGSTSVPVPRELRHTPRGDMAHLQSVASTVEEKMGKCEAELQQLSRRLDDLNPRASHKTTTGGLDVFKKECQELVDRLERLAEDSLECGCRRDAFGAMDTFGEATAALERVAGLLKRCAKMEAEMDAPGCSDAVEWGIMSDLLPRGELLQLRELMEQVQSCSSHLACADANREPIRLLRFLRAQAGDVEAAAAMFRASLDWRALSKIDEQHALWREEEAAAVTWRATLIRRFQVHHCLGRDKYGIPVYLFRWSVFDVAGAERELGTELIVQIMVSLHEDMVQELQRATRRKQIIVPGVLSIWDIGNYGKVPNWWTRMLALARFLPKVAKILESNYPEMVRKVVVVRCGVATKTLVHAVTPLMPSKTFSKCQLCGWRCAEWLPTIRDEAPDIDLPPMLASDSPTALETAFPVGGIWPVGAALEAKLEENQHLRDRVSNLEKTLSKVQQSQAS